MDRRSLLRRGIGTAALGVTATAGCITVDWNPDEGESESTPTDTPDPPSVDGEWPMARYDAANTGAIGDSGPQTKPSVTTLIDSRKDDRNLSAPGYYPTAAGDYFYFTGRDTAGIRCSSVATGELNWYGWDEEVFSNSPDWDMGFPTPIIIDDLVIVADSTAGTMAYIGAANAVTGNKLWRHDFESNDVTPHSACADEESIYLLSTEGVVYSFSHGGSLQFKFYMSNSLGYPEEIYSPILVTENHLIVSGESSDIEIIDKSGESSQVIELPGPNHTLDYGDTRYNHTPGGTAFADGHVFTAVGDSNDFTPRGQVSKCNIETGEVVWEQGFEEYSGWGSLAEPRDILGPIVYDDNIFVLNPTKYCDSDCKDNLFAISRSTGEKVWSRRLTLPSYLPVASNGIIYVTSSSLEPNAKAVSYRNKVDNGVLNRVTAFSADTGQTLWSIKVDGRIDSNPILSGGRLLVFTRNPNNVYMLS